MGLFEKIGMGIASSLVVDIGKEGVKEATKRIFSKGADFKEPVINFGLFCNFKEMPSYDIAVSELNEIIRKMKPMGKKLKQGKQSFEYDISWDIFEGCEAPDFSWEQDAIIEEENDCDKDIYVPIASSVSGFTLWLTPLSLGNRREMMISAYHILNKIKLEIQENRLFSIMKNRKFVFIGADVETCKRIHSKLQKKMTKQKLVGNPISQSLTNKTIMLVVPLREQLTAIAVSDSFKKWSVF